MADADPSWDPADVEWDPQGMTARPRRGRLAAAAAAAGAACSHGGAAPRAAPPAGGRERRCQADCCARDMASLGHYNQRNRICDVHIKTDFSRDGASFRFCQRCGTPHALAEFDGDKRSCRAQLDKHNARRRKRDAAGGAAAPPAAAPKRPAPARAAGRVAAGAAARRASPPSADDDDGAAEPELDADAGAGGMYALALPTEAELALAALPALPAPPAGPAADLADSLSSWLNDALPGAGAGAGAAAALEVAPSWRLGADDGLFPGDSFDLALELTRADARAAGSGGGGAGPSGAPAPPPRPAAPPLTSGARLATVSVKLFGCTPAELPPNLRETLESWFAGGNGGPRVAGLDGYLRPGCVHLTAQATLEAGEEAEEAAAAPAPAAAAPAAARACCAGAAKAEAAAPAAAAAAAALPCAAAAAPSALERVVDGMLASGAALWREKTMVVQAGGEVGLVAGGALLRSWRADGGAPRGRAAPLVLAAEPAVLLAGAAAPELRVRGVNLLQDGCELLVRLQGAYVDAPRAACADCACVAARRGEAGAEAFEARCCGCCVGRLQAAELGDAPGAAPAAAPAAEQAARLRLRGPLRPGLLHVDALVGPLLAPAGAACLVVGSEAVRRELAALAAAAPARTASWVQALGVVFEWVGGEAGKVRAAAAERAACRLLHWSLGAGLRATAAELLSLLQSRLMAAAAAEPAARRPSPLDGLALLSEAGAGSAAAALRRAAELGGGAGRLSLLHRAAQSGDADVVATALGWAREAGVSWRADAPGPRGLTPLHLAAVLPDPRAAAAVALLIVAACEPGADAWASARTADGLSPADFAARLGRGELEAALRLGAAAPAPPLAAPVAPAPSSCCGGGAAKGAPGGAATAPLSQPPTPRRCRCAGVCPCACAAEGCASCASSDEGNCCGGGDGTCSCCAVTSAPAGGAAAAEPRRGCCG
jgi:hypothetical protein